MTLTGLYFWTADFPTTKICVFFKYIQKIYFFIWLQNVELDGIVRLLNYFILVASFNIFAKCVEIYLVNLRVWSPKSLILLLKPSDTFQSWSNLNLTPVISQVRSTF